MTYVIDAGSKPRPPARVGLLGGTFDPPHLGHLIMAEAVRDALDLDEVRLVVANVPWQKEGTRQITPPDQRLEMVGAAVGDAPRLRASDVEIRLGGSSYTSVTLAALDRDEPGTEWYVVVGADAAAGLGTWHRPEEVRAGATLVVVDRPGWSTLPPEGWPHERVEVPLIEISSSMIRRRVESDRSIRYLCPDPVVDLIDRWGLYGPRS